MSRYFQPTYLLANTYITLGSSLSLCLCFTQPDRPWFTHGQCYSLIVIETRRNSLTLSLLYNRYLSLSLYLLYTHKTSVHLHLFCLSLSLSLSHERSFHPPTCSQGCTSAHGEATVILRPIVPLVWRVLSNKKALSSWSKTVRPTGAL